MNEQASFSGDNVIPFPRHPQNMMRRSMVGRKLVGQNTGQSPDAGFMADYERLVRAFVKIDDPKTRALIIELLKAGGAPLRWTHSGR
jgi:hypothetical protein